MLKNKHPIYALTLSLCIFGTQLKANAVESIDRSSSMLDQVEQDQLSIIDSEITQLKQQITAERKAALNAEIEAQALLQVEWDPYTKKIQEYEVHAEKAKALESRLNTLLAQRKALAEQASSSKTNK